MLSAGHLFYSQINEIYKHLIFYSMHTKNYTRHIVNPLAELNMH